MGQLTQTFVAMLVVGMLFTGTVNTLLNKLQDLTCVSHCDEPDKTKRHYFEQPVFQTLNMFIGEVACLFVYHIALLVERLSSKPPASSSAAAYHPISTDDAPAASSQDPAGETSPLISDHARRQQQDSEAQDENGEAAVEREPLVGWRNLLFVLPTLCDLTATTLMNVGLIYISASIYQMLRGSVVLFTGTLSAIFLGRNHPLYRWFALVTVFAGVAIVGLSGVVQASGTAAVPITGSPIGILLVVLAQTFTAMQFVIEEKIMARYEVPAIKAVGLEGLFGLICVGVGMPILHYTIGIHGAPGNFFDMYGGYRQVVDNPQVLWAGVGIIFSIAFFNWFGLSVTRSISATSRSTIDTCRTLFIWVVSLALQWESFKWLQVVGFAVLIYGTFVFNNVIRPPAFFARFTTDDSRIHEEVASHHPRPQQQQQQQQHDA
ncbi:hypothetical protein BC831DRAFT_473599 [Entophlyctis helioformis]|nr:hypothetical protein BC831DRAFT_473599 [Entophlyctis helioformis]